MELSMCAVLNAAFAEFVLFAGIVAVAAFGLFAHVRGSAGFP
jgi:hypothetical protein